MSTKKEWWEPDILADNEKECREKFSADNFDWGNDFGSYKAIKEGVDIEDSYLVHHNVFKEKKLKQSLFDYVNLLKKENHELPKTIADLGCGSGFTTNALKNYYENSLVIGYEISYDAIEYAKNNFPQCHFEQKKIDPSFELGEIKFDLILCQEFYPFTRTKNFDKHFQWLQFLLNNLNKDGIALITLPASNLNSINSSYKNLKKNFSLQRCTLAIPKISSKLPLLLSNLVGKVSLFTWKRLGREIYLLKN